MSTAPDVIGGTLNLRRANSRMPVNRRLGPAIAAAHQFSTIAVGRRYAGPTLDFPQTDELAGRGVELCVRLWLTDMSYNRTHQDSLKSFLAFSKRIFRSAALFGASFRIAAMVCEPEHPGPMPTRSSQSLP